MIIVVNQVEASQLFTVGEIRVDEELAHFLLPGSSLVCALAGVNEVISHKHNTNFGNLVKTDFLNGFHESANSFIVVENGTIREGND